MRIILHCTLLFAVTAAADQSWNPLQVFDDSTKRFTNFFDDQSANMKNFFTQQKNKVEKVFVTGYENAKVMSDSVNTYFEDQQKKISNDIQSYVDQTRHVADSWSYLRTDEESAKLENPEEVLSVPAIIAKNGYPCETHIVVSEGYVLNIHRIPRSKSSISEKTVLLQHGLFASSADWILNGPGKGLAYVLSDAGYDVWMTNIRGNKYSREHVSYKTDSKSFWNFSWHDVAVYDVPAIIDYIVGLKGKGTPIVYIGHSMGTTILFAMLSSRPEYNDILTAGIALAPVVFNTDMKSPLKSLAPVASNAAYMEMLYGSHEFIPKNSALGKVSASCESSGLDATVCTNFMFYICGYDEDQFEKDKIPVFLAHLGTGTSWKTVVHFAQEIASGGKFQQFDYGVTNNRRVYGGDTPPEYDLSKVTLPISLFWAENDLLSSRQDVELLYGSLSRKTEMYLIPYEKFNHLDYLVAKDVNPLLNDKLLETLTRRFSKKYFLSFSFGH